MATPAKRRSLVALIVAVVVVATALAVGVFLLLENTRTLPAFMQPLVGRRMVHILSDSMAPTLRVGQNVLVDTRAYTHDPPQRGDIVLFAAAVGGSRFSIKRIIAIPGDRLLIRNGTVSLNGQVLSEPYLLEPWFSNNSWPPSGEAVIVPANQYFVMGDNRNHSSDSRSLGYVGRDAIQGKLLL